MSRHPVLVLAVFAALTTPVRALTLSDTLSDWRNSTAMEHIRLATQLGKSFIAVNESLTADYFVKCIDDVSAYGNAKLARIEDAVRECVAARTRSLNSDDE